MNSGRVHEKVAIITGAGSGIGRATAMLLACEGAVAVVADLNEEAAQRVAAEIVAAGGKAVAARLDVTAESDWERLVELVCRDHHRLNVLVNNAGVSFAKPVDEMSLDEWRRVMSVNLDGLFLGTKWALQTMKRTGGGSVINVASVSGIKPSPGASAYCASKAAVRLFSKTVAIECADALSGIRVNLVTPGGVKTPMWEQMTFFQELVTELGDREKVFGVMAQGATASQQFITPGEVAATVLYLASDESAHLTGVEIVLDRGHT